MGRIFRRGYALSALGSFLRAFTCGRVRQLDAVASRLLTVLVGLTRPLGEGPLGHGRGPGPSVEVGRTTLAPTPCPRH